jgi:hypothetical protein
MGCPTRDSWDAAFGQNSVGRWSFQFLPSSRLPLALARFKQAGERGRFPLERAAQAADELASDGLNDDASGIFYKGDPCPLFDPEAQAQASGNNKLSFGRDDAGFNLQ